MVHINSKYIGADGTLDSSYSVNPDGVAVLGFMFEIKPTWWWWFTAKVYIVDNKNVEKLKTTYY